MTYRQIVTQWGTLARLSAVSNSLEWSLVLADIKQESSGNERAISKCGARGLMQIMPGCLADYNASHRCLYTFDQMFIPNINIIVGCWYLRHLLSRCKEDVTKALQSYNQGFSRVKKDPNAGLWYAEGVLKHKEQFDKIISTGSADPKESV